MIKLGSFKPRLYQETIFQSCVKANTLVVLPTGMGKTAIAMMLAAQRINSYPNSKVVMLAPSKPLVAQHLESFAKYMNISREEMALFTGETAPEKRAKMWKDARIIFSTPQSISNDVINNKVSLENVSCLILDEAHRATGDYDYVWLSSQYNKKASHPRLVGLTASPGSDMAAIEEVCKNIFAEEIEVRTEDDHDVKPYIQEVDIEYVNVDMPDEFASVKNDLDNCFKSKITRLREYGLARSGRLTKTEMLRMQRELQGRVASGEREPAMWVSISLLAEAIKAHHSIELLETQGVEALHRYMHKLYSEASKTKTKATKNLVIDLHFKSAYAKASRLNEENVSHPKLGKLKEIVTEEIKNPKAKIIVFNQYRDSGKLLVKELNMLNGIEARQFVGQMKKAGTGMSQKEQLKMLDEFREGSFNTLVATSVGEEGLDIPAVDLVIFFEPVPSAIRHIQRRGRTGRLEKGKVKILVTKNTTDEAYRWTAHHKEKRMFRNLKEMKSKVRLDSFAKKQPTLMDYSEKSASSIKKKEALRIYADSREKGSNIVKDLVDIGMEVRMQNLVTADFIVSEDVGVERKTVEDFVNSIVDRRMLPQIHELKKNFKKPLLIIEGREDIYSVRNVHQNAIRGMLATIAISYGIPIIHTKNSLDTAELLKAIAKREQEKDDKEFTLRQDRKPLTGDELKEYIVESLPGVGPLLSKSLLKEFKSVKNIINAEEKELQKVEKLGKKKASEIREVVDGEYGN
ncbi:MAG: DEAD/DEAH box helicase [Candidatus Woesearchaeota archaeon]